MEGGKEERKNDCTWKNNKHESTLHRVLIYKISMSFKMQRSDDDKYVIFNSVKLDDPPIKKIGEFVESFII